MRRKKKKSKSQAQKIHAKRRFAMRCGMTFGKNKEQFFINAIQSNSSLKKIKQTNRTTIHYIEYDEQVFKVVYDKQRKNIVTVLPCKEKLEDLIPKQSPRN